MSSTISLFYNYFRVRRDLVLHWGQYHTRFRGNNIEELLIKNDSYMLIISRVDSLPSAILEMKANGIEYYCAEIWCLRKIWMLFII